MAAFRNWDFLGKLKENGKRVITSATAVVTTIKQDEKPKVTTTVNDGNLHIGLSFPEIPTVENLVGEKYFVDGEERGEIFSEYKKNSAEGAYSAAFGLGTSANSDSQFVIGSYNDNKKENLFEIGNGTQSSRGNAFEVDKFGNTTCNGNFIAKGDIQDASGLSFKYLDENKLDKTELSKIISACQPLVHSVSNEVGFDSTTNFSIDWVNILTMKTIVTDSCYPFSVVTIPFHLSGPCTVSWSYYEIDINNNISRQIPYSTVTQQYQQGGHYIKTLLRNYQCQGATNYVVKLRMKVTPAVAVTIEANTIQSIIYNQGTGLMTAWSGDLSFKQIFEYYYMPIRRNVTVFKNYDSDISIKFPEHNNYGTYKEKIPSTGVSCGRRNIGVIPIKDAFNDDMESKDCTIKVYSDHWIYSTKYLDDAINNYDYFIVDEENKTIQLRGDYQLLPRTLDVDEGKLEIINFINADSFSTIDSLKVFGIEENNEEVIEGGQE